MRVSSQQVQSMNCTMQLVVRELLIIISNKIFYFLLLNGFDFLKELDEPNRFEKSLAYDVHFVCATPRT